MDGSSHPVPVDADAMDHGRRDGSSTWIDAPCALIVIPDGVADPGSGAG
jgi:hypothetical protein